MLRIQLWILPPTARRVEMGNCKKKKKNVEEGRFSATNVSGLALAGLELGHIRSATTPRVLCTQLLMQRAERAAIRRSSIFHTRSIHNIQTRLTCRVALAEHAVAVVKLTGAEICTRHKHSSLFPPERLIFCSPSRSFGPGSVPALSTVRRPFH